MKRVASLAALLVGLVVAMAPVAAHAEETDNLGRPLLADQFFGILLRMGTGPYVGDGANDTPQPSWGYGGSLQIRIARSPVWVDISGDSHSPFSAKEPEGGFLLATDRQTVGLRARLPLDGKSRFILGGGGGGVRENLVVEKKSYSGGAAYAVVGWEHETFGDTASGSYIGIEAAYHHYFMGSQAPMKGGIPEIRATFSYYFGGSDAQDCW